jgi:hypothetical protein
MRLRGRSQPPGGGSYIYVGGREAKRGRKSRPAPFIPAKGGVFGGLDRGCPSGRGGGQQPYAQTSRGQVVQAVR